MMAGQPHTQVFGSRTWVPGQLLPGQTHWHVFESRIVGLAHVLGQTHLQVASSTFGAVHVLGQTQVQSASRIFGFTHLFGQTQVQVLSLTTLGAGQEMHCLLQQVSLPPQHISVLQQRVPRGQQTRSEGQ